ncbi:MAG: ATP-binding protein [Anaerolinea sp.]|nr:ATP-binding protein [Anaerolinea sp.]
MIWITPAGKRIYTRPVKKRTSSAVLRKLPWGDLFDEMPRPLLLIDLDTLRIIHTNAAAEAFYGWTVDELRGRSLGDLHADDELPALRQAAASGLSGPEAHRRWHQRSRSGAALHVRMNAFPAAVGSRRYCLIDIQDESGLLRTEEALLMTQTLIDQVQETVGLGLWIAGIDAEAAITWMPNVYRIYGVDPAAFQPTPEAVLALIHPDDRERFFRALNEAIAENGQFTLEHRIVRPSGEVRWVHQRASTIVAADDVPVRMLGLILDITDRKQRDDALLEQERLRTALAHETSLRQFQERYVSLLSHEFKTPLASMSLALDMLLRYGVQMTERERRERILRLQRTVADLNQLIEDMQILVQAEMGGQFARRDDIALDQLIQNIVENSEQGGLAPEQRRIKLTGIDTPQVKASRISGDARLLKHALANLIGNALKYSPQDAPIQVTLRQCGDELLVTIADSGIGITPDDLAHVFEPFYRGSNVGDQPGTGLGLTIAHQVVRLHEGRIDVQSEPGRGTTFTIALPLKRAGAGKR